MPKVYMATKVQIIVSRGSSWIWRAEADVDAEVGRQLTDEEFKLVREALPRLLKQLLAPEPEPEPATQVKRSKK